MKNSLMSISKIFSESLFRIPDYQRGYSWGMKQLDDFWSDLDKISEGKNHYIGVLTLEGVPKETYDRWDEDRWIIESRKYEPFFIVDGQQRLTTIILLINSILEKVDFKSKINYTDCEDIRKKFIFDSKDDGISRSYIFGYEKDNPSYNFLKKEIFLESCDDEIEETIYTQNLKKTKEFFSRKLEKYSKEEIEKLYTNVTQNLLFNIFTISEDVDVCIAFETMNNRGKPLSHLELLKNRLIYISTQVNGVSSDKEQLRRNINACWKSIYHNLGRNKNKPLPDDEFLITHCNIFFHQNLLDSDAWLFHYKRDVGDYSNFLLGEVFNQKNITLEECHFSISIKSVNAYVQSLKELVKIWYYIFNPQASSYSLKVKHILFRLNHLGMGSCVTSILVFMKNIKNDENLFLVLNEMERFLFVLSIIRDSYFSWKLSRRKKAFFDLSMQLEKREIDEIELSKRIREFSNKLTAESDFSRSLPEALRWSGGFYNWDRIRYFLYEYEMFLKEQTRNNRSKIEWESFADPGSDYITVEHIYPQQARNKYWTERFGRYNQKQKQAIRNSLGNLLPLSRRKNSSLSNKPFPIKVNGENKENKKNKQFIAYKFGSYSEIEVSRENDWTAEKILERGIRMLEFMEKRWQIKLGGIERKKEILGIKIIEK